MNPRPQIDHIRRPQMLRAAAAVIAERGIGDTRVADVAERAGSSPAAVLYWFTSKDDLLLTALIDEEERLADRVATELAAIDRAPAKLARIFEICATGSEWPLWIELWARALHHREAAVARDRLDLQWREMFERVIADGVSAGDFTLESPGEVKAAARTLACLVDGLALQVALGDSSIDRAAMLESCYAVTRGTLGCDLSAFAAPADPGASPA